MFYTFTNIMVKVKMEQPGTEKYFVFINIKIILIVILILFIFETVNRVLILFGEFTVFTLLLLIFDLTFTGLVSYVILFFFRIPIIEIDPETTTLRAPFSSEHSFKVKEIKKTIFYNSSEIQLLLTKNKIQVIKLFLLSTTDKNVLIGSIHDKLSASGQ